MKLHFWNVGNYRPGWRNFGDHLNPWLWPRLLPGAFEDGDRETVFVGIGTLLNDKLGPFPRTVVFGTGHGYGRGGLPRLDPTWTIYCVRGPHTARALGLPPESAIADAALLLRRFVDPAAIPRRFDVSYMPHFSDLIRREGSLRRACALARLHFIDPRAPVEEVINEIAASRLLVCAAMHGAIAADALRVPWIAVRSGRHILDFKWEDWCASMGLRHSSRRILGVPTLRGRLPHLERLEAGLLAAGLRLAARSRPSLSDDRVLERRIEQLGEKVEVLREDLAQGRLRRNEARRAPGSPFLRAHTGCVSS